MAINNITQTISTLPPAGSRGVDVQTQFVIKQEDFQDHLQGTTVNELNTLKDQLNSRIGEINSTTTTMNGYANTASAGASTATTKAGEASTSALDALSYKNQAETFKNNASTSATKAGQWADNNYNVEVEAGRYSAKHWSTVAQNAVNNKIDKVASTDNAIARYDGTTGKLQNSSVTIDDNGNVGIGTSSPTYNLDIRNTQTTGTPTDNAMLQLKSSNRNSSIQLDTIGGSYAGIINTSVNGTNVSQLKFDSIGNILSILPKGGLGYGTGSGGTVTQLTSKSTSVTLNKPTGQITMNSAALAAGVSVSFTFTNSLIANTDILILSLKNGTGSVNAYKFFSECTNGNGVIQITNISGISLAEAIVINFAIIKGAIV